MCKKDPTDALMLIISTLTFWQIKIILKNIFILSIDIIIYAIYDDEREKWTRI